MSAIISNKFRVRAAEAMKRYITNQDNSVYMYLGKSTPWAKISDVSTDPTNNLDALYSSYNDCIIAKRILLNSAMLCANRYDWSIGNVYDQYDTRDEALYEGKKFYVMTDEFNIYKCLNNNFGARSTVKPVGTHTAVINSSDGYSWKYMGTLTNNEARFFLNSQFIPLSNNPESGTPSWVNMSAAINGSIDSYIIDNTGAGYTHATVTIIGDGTGAAAVPVITAGRITKIQITSSGQDYTWAQVVISGNGSGAVVTPMIAPRGGHGANPAEELGGYYVMIMMDFGGVTSDYLPRYYSFRKIGIIDSPKNYNDEVHTDYILGGTHIINTNADRLKINDTLEFESGITCIVLDIADDKKSVIVSEATDININETYFVVEDPSVTGIVTDVINPEIDKLSWDPLFIEHRNAISTDASQSEYVRFVVEF